jgi:hypothetical protein
VTLLTRKDKHVGTGLFDSIAWAFEVHVKQPDLGVFRSALLYGNEDAPERIEFYRVAKLCMKHVEKPAMVWTPEGIQ